MNGIIVSILVGLCTGIGSLPFLFINRVSSKVKDGLLGFTGGIMVFASSFSLLQPALNNGSMIHVILGIVVGALILTLIEKMVPHIHARDLKKSEKNNNFNKVLLLAIAVAIHNIPEGFAIGIGYGSGNQSAGLNLALAIGIQNIPEGLVVAATMVEEGYPKKKTIIFSFLTGLGEPVAAIVGIFTASLITRLLPYNKAITFYLCISSWIYFFRCIP